MTTSNQREQVTDIREDRVAPSPEQPLSELVANLTEDSSRLFRQEVALAKAELKQELVIGGVAVAMMAVAGVVATVSLIMLSFAAAEGLQRGLDIDIAWCLLIVGVVWAVAATGLYLAGRRRMEYFNPTPERSVETLKRIPETVKGQR